MIIRDAKYVSIAERQDWKCPFCERSELEIYEAIELFERHHVNAKCHNGGDRPSNLQLVCSKCHHELHPNNYEQNRGEKSMLKNVNVQFCGVFIEIGFKSTGDPEIDEEIENCLKEAHQ